MSIIVALIFVPVPCFLFRPGSDSQMPTVHLKKWEIIRSEILALAQAKDPGTLMVIRWAAATVSSYWQLEKREKRLVKIILGT